MSDYLVNLARRSVGIAPMARPRSGPGPGPIAGMVRGVEQPSPSSTPVRGGPLVGTDSSLRSGSLRLIGVEPARDEAERAHRAAPSGSVADGPARVIRETEPTGRGGSGAPRLADRAPAVAGVADAPATRIVPGQQASTGAGPSLPARATSPNADRPSDMSRGPEPDRNRPAVEPRRDDVTVVLPLPASPDGPRRIDPSGTVLIEPALAPAPLGGLRAIIEDGTPGREVHVRIGTIEIHAESDTPPPTPVPPAAAPALSASPQGGFDEFVRLRTYAPWER